MKKRRSNGCFLCGQKGHGRYECTVLKKYQSSTGTIIRSNNQSQRDELMELILDTSGKNCFKRKTNDKRLVNHELPKRVKAVIIDQKMIINNDAVLLLHSSNFCLECTLLGERGLPIENYVNAIFAPGCINRFVAKSKTSLVVNNVM